MRNENAEWDISGAIRELQEALSELREYGTVAPGTTEEVKRWLGVAIADLEEAERTED